mmetsp:Transcript_1367/g.2882  ORF Transcript_1367/g.2882 Transcript_1367/m.2882 type:complete len:204 (+) Transcript_1367:324-935(+)
MSTNSLDSRRWRSFIRMNSSCKSSTLSHGRGGIIALVESTLNARQASARGSVRASGRISGRASARSSGRISGRVAGRAIFMLDPKSSSAALSNSDTSEAGSTGSIRVESAPPSFERSLGDSRPKCSSRQSSSGEEGGEELPFVSARAPNPAGMMIGLGPRCFERLRAIFSPSSSRGTISRHLRLMQACFLMPGPPNFGLSAQL